MLHADHRIGILRAKQLEPDVVADHLLGHRTVVRFQWGGTRLGDDDVGALGGNQRQQVGQGLAISVLGNRRGRQTGIAEIEDRARAGVGKTQHVAIARRAGQLGADDLETHLRQQVHDDAPGHCFTR